MTAWTRPISHRCTSSTSSLRTSKASACPCTSVPWCVSDLARAKPAQLNPALQTSFLKDLPAADLHEDEEALEEFCDRLRPFLGDLIEQHARLIVQAEDVRVQPDWEPPFVKMAIRTTMVGSDKTFYFTHIDPAVLS